MTPPLKDFERVNRAIEYYERERHQYAKLCVALAALEAELREAKPSGFHRVEREFWADRLAALLKEHTP